MGNRARGLQRPRQRLGLLPARPRTLTRLSLGRGRDRRHFRRPPASVLRVGLVERQGPDPQGAAVRPHQRRGQSRRGREGVLFLPGQHADPQLHADALQVSARRVSLRAARARERPPQGGRSQRARVRADRTPGCSRRSDISTSWSNMPSAPPTTSWCASPSPIAAPSSASRLVSCRRSGSATPGAGSAARTSRALRRPDPARHPGAAFDARRPSPDLRRGRRHLVRRQRDQYGAPVRRRRPGLSQGRDQRPADPQPRHRQPRSWAPRRRRSMPARCRRARR